MSTPNNRRVHIAVIGAGPGGLCMGKRLLDEGIDDFVLLEVRWGGRRLEPEPLPRVRVRRAVGALLVLVRGQARLVQALGTQPRDPQVHAAGRREVRPAPHVRLGDGVRRAVWHEPSASWTLTLDDGATVTADIVVSAIGMFNDLAQPDIDGLDTFAGTMFHSAQWTGTTTSPVSASP